MGIFARTRSLALVSLLLAVASAGVYVFFVDRIIRVGRSAAELASAIEVETERDKHLRGQQRLLSELEQEETALNERFVNPDGVVDFIELIEAVGKDAGVVVEVASVAVEPGAGENLPYEWLKVSFRASGSWKQLFHFVMLVETAPYAVRLEQVGLNFEPSDGVLASRGNWEGTFVLHVGALRSAESSTP